MKANQAFKQADEAVSPVIGVILMVAITVVLAAVVFVLVGNLTDTSDAAPTITFTKNDDDAVVQSSPSGNDAVQWGSINFGGTCTGVAVSDVTSASTGLAANDTTDVLAGDYITSDCGAGTTLIISYAPSSGTSFQLASLDY